MKHECSMYACTFLNTDTREKQIVFLSADRNTVKETAPEVFTNLVDTGIVQQGPWKLESYEPLRAYILTERNGIWIREPHAETVGSGR